MRREAAANIQNFDFMTSAAGFVNHSRCHIQGLDEILKIGALAADMETQSLHHESEAESFYNQVHRFARITAEFRGQLHHRAGVRHTQAQHHSGIGRVLLDLL